MAQQGLQCLSCCGGSVTPRALSGFAAQSLRAPTRVPRLLVTASLESAGRWPLALAALGKARGVDTQLSIAAMGQVAGVARGTEICERGRRCAVSGVSVLGAHPTDCNATAQHREPSPAFI